MTNLVIIITVPETYAASHLSETEESAGAAENKAAANKILKYSTLATTHHFVPISVKTGILNHPNLSLNSASEFSKLHSNHWKHNFFSKGCPYRCRGETN